MQEQHAGRLKAVLSTMLLILQKIHINANDYFSSQDKQEVAGQNLMFLLDYTYLSNSDISTNNTTFTWAEKIVPIITST